MNFHIQLFKSFGPANHVQNFEAKSDLDSTSKLVSSCPKLISPNSEFSSVHEVLTLVPYALCVCLYPTQGSFLNLLRERCQGLEERLIMEQQLKATATTATTSAVQSIDTREIIDRSKRDEEEIRRLQFELVRLTTDLTNAQSHIFSLEQRLDGALRGRLRYKDLWTRALQEVTRLRQEATNATKLELQRKEAEVEGLRKEQNLLLRAGSCMVLQNNPGQSNGDYAQRPILHYWRKPSNTTKVAAEFTTTTSFVCKVRKGLLNENNGDELAVTRKRKEHCQRSADLFTHSERLSHFKRDEACIRKRYGLERENKACVKDPPFLVAVSYDSKKVPEVHENVVKDNRYYRGREGKRIHGDEVTQQVRVSRTIVLSSTNRMEGVTSTIPDNPNICDPVLDAQLKRLHEEKQNLLASGIYYEDDVLIMDLDKEIQRLQVAITNTT
ncbi:hypothetical protein ACTXT7_008810 [Hymenolepis weldensis]